MCAGLIDIYINLTSGIYTEKETYEVYKMEENQKPEETALSVLDKEPSSGAGGRLAIPREDGLHASREGTFKSFVKPIMKANDKGFTKEFVSAFVKNLDKYVEKFASAACDEAESAGRKGVTVEHLRAAMEKQGIEL